MPCGRGICGDIDGSCHGGGSGGDGCDPGGGACSFCGLGSISKESVDISALWNGKVPHSQATTFKPAVMIIDGPHIPAGLQIGDGILKVNGQDCQTGQGFKILEACSPQTGPFVFLIVRIVNGVATKLTVTVPGAVPQS